MFGLEIRDAERCLVRYRGLLLGNKPLFSVSRLFTLTGFLSAVLLLILPSSLILTCGGMLVRAMGF